MLSPSFNWHRQIIVLGRDTTNKKKFGCRNSTSFFSEACAYEMVEAIFCTFVLKSHEQML
jgi:hypothetical protein